MSPGACALRPGDVAPAACHGALSAGVRADCPLCMGRRVCVRSRCCVSAPSLGYMGILSSEISGRGGRQDRRILALGAGATARTSILLVLSVCLCNVLEAGAPFPLGTSLVHGVTTEGAWPSFQGMRAVAVEWR